MITLLRYVTYRNAHVSEKYPSALNLLNALGEAAFLSTLMTRGSLVCEAARILRKNCLTAFASLVGLNRKSSVFPCESPARERDPFFLHFALRLINAPGVRRGLQMGTAPLFQFGRRAASPSGRSWCDQRTALVPS